MRASKPRSAVAAREEVRSPARHRVERVDLVVVGAAELAVGRPAARQRDAGRVARQRDEGHPPGGRVDADHDHRVRQVAGDPGPAAIGADEQDVEALLAVPSSTFGVGSPVGSACAGLAGAGPTWPPRRRQRHRGGVGVERDLRLELLEVEDEGVVLRRQGLEVRDLRVVAGVLGDVVDGVASDEDRLGDGHVAGQQHDDDGHQAGRGEQARAGRTDAAGRAPGARHRAPRAAGRRGPRRGATSTHCRTAGSARMVRTRCGPG